MKSQISTRHCLNALRRRYKAEEWALVVELPVGAKRTSAENRRSEALHKQGAETDWDPRNNTDSRIDVWAMHLWHESQTIAFEIKVDRGDFERELSNPDKRAPAMALAHQFYFVTPKGLIDVAELPEHCGLIEITGVRQRNSTLPTYHAGITKPADWRDIEDLPRSFIASLALKAS